MRQVASFLLIVMALPAMATETWRWKDESGVVHYSDRPVPGAERIKVGPAAGSGSTAGTASTLGTQASTPPLAQPAAEFRYSSCVVLAPANDEVFNAVNSVNASLQISPGLRPGHRVQVVLDGKPYPEWPGGSLGYTLANIYRGSHTLGVQVLDADGRSLCAGPAITFHVRQPSILSPARQPPPKVPKTPNTPKP